MGYVGPVLVNHLRSVFPESVLVGCDLGWFAHCLTGVSKMPEIALNLQWYRDVRALTIDDLSGFDAVIHLAAISNDPMGKDFEDLTDEINHRASVSLAEKAKAAGVRTFVFASSCSVYGAGGDSPRRENDRLNPLTAYAKSKIDTEAGLQKFASDNFSIICLRFATACGYSQRTRLDLVLNDFVATALSCKDVNVLSDGSPWRPLIHVSDMARAMEWALTTGGENFITVNAGSDVWNYQVKDLAHAVAEKISGVSVHINKNAPADKRSYQVDFTLYKELAPRHQPLVSLEKAVDSLIDGLISNNINLDNFRNGNFIRLNQLREHLALNVLSEELTWL
jgi:nucleoside-diphosphate-sugar epimerase